MQKPILSLFTVIVIVACVGTALYANMHLSSKNTAYPVSTLSDVTVAETANIYAITCPDPMRLTVGANCLANVTVPTPSSSCNNILSLSYTLPNGTVVPLSSPFPSSVDLGDWSYGVYNLRWDVVENCTGTAASAVCNITITIDLAPPTITCPASLTVGNLNGRRSLSSERMMFTFVDVGEPTVSDNCTPVGDITVRNSRNNTNNADGSYPVGTTVIIWTATDISGNSATCSMSVIVEDDTPPTITCPSAITASCEEPVAVVSFTDFQTAGGSASDETQLNQGSFTHVSDVSNNMTCPETITRTYRISDNAGNSNTCSQTIVVHDITPPTALCKDITVFLDGNGEARPLASSLDNGSSDLCGAVTFTTNPSMRFFGCNDVNTGAIPFTLIVSDACGNTATCVSNITVIDNLPPTIITCPADITINTAATQCYATNVTLDTPTAPDDISDNCSIRSTVATLNMQVVDVNTIFPKGTNIVTWTVTDISGNSTACTQTVFVQDKENPTIITCPTDVTINTTLGQCNATNVNLTPPTTNDNCPGQTSVATFGMDVVSSATIFDIGSNTVVWTVTDASGNSATCSQNVLVVDNEKPIIITCPTNVTINNSPLLCSGTNVTLIPPITSDNCPGQTSVATFGINVVTSSTIFNVGSNTVIWKVTDARGNTNSCSQTVIVVDNEKPKITCPVDLTVALDNDCDLTMPDLTKVPLTSDNCMVASVTQNPTAGTVITSEHNQTHVVTFTVTDVAGNSTSCPATITAKDVLAPDITCKGLQTISITDFPELYASSFLTVIPVDQCGGPLTYRVRRMGNVCGGTTEDDFGPSVVFCCDDVNQVITVVIEVSDQHGNTNTCMTTVKIEDNLKPTITVGSLPDITVSCAYPIDLNDLSAFGTLVPDELSRKDIIINDPNNPFYGPTMVAGKDGLYTENCPNAVVTVKTTSLLTMCNTGQIKRDFTVTDIANNTSEVYTQTIFVKDVAPFTMDDITWPAKNVDYFDCNDADPDTSVTGAPVLNTDRCNMVAATYKDASFSHPTGCTYIERTWSVVDWCQYVANSGSSTGKWTYVQNIFVKNTVAPTIDNNVCADVTICSTNSACNATASFSASGDDDCKPANLTWKYFIDLDNNGGAADLSGSGPTVSRTFNVGVHKLTWQVTDKCGNTNTCSFLFTIKDCKAPVAVAMQGLAINLSNISKSSTIWGSDFNNFSSDNCTGSSQLRYSFTSDPTNTNRTYTCDSLGQRRVDLWVTDLAGNQSKTITYVVVQDNENVCGTSNKVNIAGKLYTEDKINISETKVTIVEGEKQRFLMTDTNGAYTFNDLTMYKSYNLQPTKDTNHVAGISTIDLVIIQRHILGIKHLESPYKIIAADVNNSQSITAADLVELRKIVLGVQSKFSKNTSWRFVDAAFIFSDPSYPWPYTQQLTYPALDVNMPNSDFIGVKIGDVNNSASQFFNQNVSARSKDKRPLYIDDNLYNGGEIATIPVKIDDIQNFVAFQWTFELSENWSYEGFEGVDIPFGSENIAVIERNNKQYLSISIDNPYGYDHRGSVTLFNVLLKPKTSEQISRGIQLSNTVTPAYAYDQSLSESDLILQWKTVEKSSPSKVYQNHPNPFTDQTIIDISLQEKSAVTISVYDSEGIQIYKNTETFDAGTHNLILGNDQLGEHSGIFFCKIKATELNEVIKIMRIE